MIKYVMQHDQRDCGPACLSMVAACYGFKRSLSYFREITKTDRSGTNLYGLTDAAKRIGLVGDALSGSEDELMEEIRKGNLLFPFIAHIISEDAMYHYVVVFGFRNGKFLIGDPANGKRRMKTEAFFALWTGYIITFRKSGTFRPEKKTYDAVKSFFTLLKGQVPRLFLVLLLSLLVAFIGILGSFVFQVIMDGLSIGGKTAEGSGLAVEIGSMLNGSATEQLRTVFLSLIGLYLLQGVTQVVRGWLIAKVSRTIDIRLSLSYFNHIVDLPVSSLQVRQTGEYLSRFSDIANIRQAVSGAAVTLLLDSCMVAACGVILFIENRQLFLISLGMVIVYAVLVLSYRNPVNQSYRTAMENDARVQSYFKESIDGIETVKATCAEKQVKHTASERFSLFVNSTFRNGLITLSQETLADMVELIGTVLLLWAGFSMVLSKTMTIGSLITFYALLAYFTEPIKNLISLQPMLQSAFVAVDRLNDILDLQTENTEETAMRLSPVQEWKLHHIDFRYGNRELTLQDVNISIRQGEKIALVGESGSGKTTLAKLLLRFYSPEKGKILLDGRDIQSIELSSLRQKIAYVDQNTFLFSDTIRNNLTLGRTDITEEDIQRVCKLSRADTFISKLPMGLDTQLDENGANLSGGERQRLAIARALLKKPQLLILDEATSNLDTVTEAAIRDTVFELGGDMTCIIIAHRLSTIRECDRIYVMEQGGIIEVGTHQELLSHNGRYAAFWKHNYQ